ncbi:SIRT6 [Ramazzottius varieornatus]|uniref:protein acetyllysine N-acetyltransferase n=1 Tax=Ramazzottius varieornatus TaxID=947166 RepID=A0A1D1VR77_RAMVA|nr:SIRT6 [Ramazzottius varieornatus]
MSGNYAAGLSKYANKGILGLPEHEDSPEFIRKKISLLVQMIRSAQHVVVHTGAGISTSAGIADFRGPKGIWTAEKKKIAPATSKPFDEVVPTYTHMALVELVRQNVVQFVISQNIDGLHLRSGLSPGHLAEMHGNIFMERCRKCRRLYTRKTLVPTIGVKPTGGICEALNARGSPCRGVLVDTMLDWKSPLPLEDLDAATLNAKAADLNIVLGSTMQITPAGDLPRSRKQFDPNAKFVICNLQQTKFDGDADLIMRAKVDDIFAAVMAELGLKAAPYSKETDPVLATTNERKEFVRALKHPPEHRVRPLTATDEETKPEIVPKKVEKSRKRKFDEENDLG